MTASHSSSAPAHPHLLQGDILHLFSDLIHLTPELVVYPDYTIETPIGFFKLAYSEATHTSALFYSRHADNLSGSKDDDAEIAKKDFLYLIGMHKHYHSHTSRWDKRDPRLQLDLTWVPSAIHNLLYRLPRTSLRESTLHKVNDDFVSTFAIYKPEEAGNDQKTIRMSTKTGERFHFIRSVHEPRTAGRIRGWLKKLSPEFNLATTSGTLRHDKNYSFHTNDIIEAIITDFHNRLLQIWKGEDPVSWRENAITPVARVAAALRDKAVEIAEEPREHLLRHFAEVALHTILAGPLGTLETILIQRSAGVGERHMQGITPEWEDIGTGHFKRFKTISSSLHELLVQPDVTKFGDLRWITPDKAKVSFSHHDQHCDDTRERKFKVWVKSQLLAPYASVMQYWPTASETHDTEHVKGVLASSSNGVQIFYIPGQKHIYTYYNCPDNHIHARKLQSDAPYFYEAGTVLKFNMANLAEPLQRLDFETFKTEFLNLSGLNEAAFPKSQEPPRELIVEDTELNRHFLPG